MQLVVPLAGPDFELPSGGTKAEIVLDGAPLLRRALEGRSWWRNGEYAPDAMVFVLRDTDRSRAFAEGALLSWYPQAATVFVGRETPGAAFSALAGIAAADPSMPLCIDLADILYDCEVYPTRAFESDANLGGIVPTFQSDKEIYSYLRTDDHGFVVEAAEKRVISGHASAGTYFFRDAATYAAALAHSIRHRDNLTFRGRYFVCPLFNGVIANGQRVRRIGVENVVDLKLQ